MSLLVRRFFWIIFVTYRYQTVFMFYERLTQISVKFRVIWSGRNVKIILCYVNIKYVFQMVDND